MPRLKGSHKFRLDHDINEEEATNPITIDNNQLSKPTSVYGDVYFTTEIPETPVTPTTPTYRHGAPIFEPSTVVNSTFDKLTASFEISSKRDWSNLDGSSYTGSDRLLTKFRRSGQWSSTDYYRISVLVVLVGLGTWWRFPATAYVYGGGTFAFAYFLTWLFIGVPISMLEQWVGQFCSQGPFKAWSNVPLLKGLAFAEVFLSLYLAVSFGALTTWSSLYFGSAIRTPPAWERNITIKPGFDAVSLGDSEMFFQSHILHLAPMENISMIYWQPIVGFAVCWGLTILITTFRIAVIEKILVVPAALLIMAAVWVTIYTCLQDNVYEGFSNFVIPTWKNLANGQLWYAAVTQVAYSEGLGFGILVSLGSRKDFKWPVFSPAFLGSLVGLLTCAALGTTAFSILSEVTHEPNSMEKVQLGYGLMFIGMFDVASSIPIVPQLWVALLFAAIAIGGIGCSVLCVLNIMTISTDILTSFRHKEWIITIITGLVCMALSVPFATEGGLYFLKLLDTYGISILVILCILLETVGMVWVYGPVNLAVDVQFMTGASCFTWIAWLFALVPLLILAIIAYALVDFTLPTLDGRDIPVWGHAIGGVILGTPVICLIGWMVYTINSQVDYGLFRKFKSAATTSASSSWGPKEPFVRGSWKKFIDDRFPVLSSLSTKEELELKPTDIGSSQISISPVEKHGPRYLNI